MPIRVPSMRDWNRDDPALAGLGTTGAWGDIGFESPAMDEELYASLLNRRNSNKIRKLRTEADVQRALDEDKFLNSINLGDTGRVYQAPADDRASRLQGLMNRDYLARERGSRLSMAGILRNQALERADRPYNLNLAQFRAGRGDEAFRRAIQNRSFAANRSDEMNQRDYRERQFEDEQAWREASAMRAAAETALRERRLDQQNARDTAVGNRFESRQTREEQQRAMAAALAMGQRGIPLRDVEASFGAELTPPQRALLRSYDQRARQEGQFAEALASQYNQRLQGIPTVDTTTEQPGFMRRGLNYILPGGRTSSAEPTVITTPRTPESIAADRERIEIERSRDRRARDMIVFDPDSNSYVPIPRYAGMGDEPSRGTEPADAEPIPVPENFRSRYQEGRVYRNTDGAFRYQNGYLIRVR